MAGAKKGTRIEPILSGILAAGAVAMPERNTVRGSKSVYPFDQLSAVGMSFAVFNKTPEQLASIISNQNRKPGKPKVDATGNPVFKMTEMIDAQGNKTNVPTNERDHDKGPQFFAAVPAEDDPANFGEDKKKLPKDKRALARVFRSE